MSVLRQKRLEGSIRQFHQNMRQTGRTLISASFDFHNERKIIVDAFSELKSSGRITKIKTDRMLENLESQRINIKLNTYPKTHKASDIIRDRIIRDYENRTQFLLDQSIVSLATSFEEFTRRMFIKFYSDDPRRFSPDKEVKLSEIADKPDLHEFYRELAEAKTKDLLYGSTAKWFTHFDKILKFKFESTKLEKESNNIIELFLIRNCIVHNAKFISKELVTHKPRYAGMQKVSPTYKDYARFKKAAYNIVNELHRLYNEKYSEIYISANPISEEMKRIHHRMNNSNARSVQLNLPRAELNGLAVQYQSLNLTEVRRLLTGEFYDAKILGVKILILQYKNPAHQEGRMKILMFCLLNLDLFDSWELVNFITRNITTMRQVAGHNINLLKSMSYYASPFRAYFVLRLIQQDPDITTRKQLAWIVRNIERHSIRSSQGKERQKLLEARRAANRALQS